MYAETVELWQKRQSLLCLLDLLCGLWNCETDFGQVAEAGEVLQEARALRSKLHGCYEGRQCFDCLVLFLERH